jgi:hypothetical protein
MKIISAIVNVILNFKKTFGILRNKKRICDFKGKSKD